MKKHKNAYCFIKTGNCVFCHFLPWKVSFKHSAWKYFFYINAFWNSEHRSYIRIHILGFYFHYFYNENQKEEII